MSFTERLKIELGRNKKKTAILGVMCLVALYYWAPLVASWLGGSESAEAETDENAAPAFVVQNSTSPGNAPTSSQQAAKLAWTQLVALADADPLMSPATLPAGFRNPFADFIPPPEVTETAVKQAKPEPAVEPVAAEPVHPESLDELDLQLTNVFLGRRFRIAKINGKSYRENEVLSAGGFDFTVAEFHATHAVLTLGEKSYELHLEKPGLGGDNVVIVH